MSTPPRPEPFAARLHILPRLLRRPQRAMVRLLRGYFTRAPGWVLLTTRGRTTGLDREVLMPCERTSDTIILISTYGWQSNWIRNIRKDPHVRVTCAGWVLPGSAEVIEDVEAKRALVTAHPFFAAMPVAPLHAVLRTILRPLLILFLRWWVTSRPMVVIRRADAPAGTGER